MCLPPARTPGLQDTDGQLLEKAAPSLGLPQACPEAGSWARSPSGADLSGPAGLGSVPAMVQGFQFQIWESFWPLRWLPPAWAQENGRGPGRQPDSEAVLFLGLVHLFSGP